MYINLKRMKRLNLSLLIAGVMSCQSIVQASEMLQFQNSMLHPIEVVPDKSTGLDAIYVIYEMDGVNIRFTSSNPSGVRVYTYSNPRRWICRRNY